MPEKKSYYSIDIIHHLVECISCRTCTASKIYRNFVCFLSLKTSIKMQHPFIYKYTNTIPQNKYKYIALWGFLDLKSELIIKKGETQNQGKNGQI